MSKPIEGCPQPETPIRERAWTAEQEVKKETDADVLTALGDDAAKWAAEFRATALRLGYSDMDEGWLIGWFANAIEHSGDVRRWRKEAALRQQGEQAGGVVSDEKLMDVVQKALLEYRLCSWADEGGDSLSLLDHLSAGETIQSGRDEIEQIADAVCEAVAPLLRAPAEQGGMGDAGSATDAQITAEWFKADGSVHGPNVETVTMPLADYLKFRRSLCSQAALAQNAQGEAVAYVEEYNLDGRQCRGLVWADHPANTPGHTFTPLTYLHAERARVPNRVSEGWIDDNNYRDKRYVAGWNACRDAMLAAATSQPEDAA